MGNSTHIRFVDPSYRREIMMENNLVKFDFNSSHNNFPAIESLNPIDIGTERQFRFTAKIIADMLDVSFDTIKRRVELLESTKDLSHSNLSAINPLIPMGISYYRELPYFIIQNPRFTLNNKFFGKLAFWVKTIVTMTFLS